MNRKQGLAAFWRELRRRHVVRAGGVYVASGFVVLQLGEIVLPAFNAPDWVLQSLVVLVFLGLPVVLAFAWVYDLTPEGLAKTREQQGGARVTIAPRLALLAATSISVALGALWFLRSGATGDGGDGAEAVETAPPAAARTASLDPDAPITAIAVLPLADFAQRDDLFARQLHEEIITQLSLLSSLRVVSRTSVERYADSNMLLPDIAAELGVQAVVTGSVAMTSESDSVRISVQLLHAATDTHMLSRSFQRELKDILRLQTEVAVEIAESVQGELGDDLSAEAEMVAEVDPEAYRAFLQGQQELERGTPEALEAALGHFDRSAELDPGYAQPLAWRAGTHLMLATDGDSVPEDVLAQVRGDLERAGLLGGAEDEVAATMVILRDRIGADVSGIEAGIDDAFAQAGRARRLRNRFAPAAPVARVDAIRAPVRAPVSARRCDGVPGDRPVRQRGRGVRADPGLGPEDGSGMGRARRGSSPPGPLRRRRRSPGATDPRHSGRGAGGEGRSGAPARDLRGGRSGQLLALATGQQRAAGGS